MVYEQQIYSYLLLYFIRWCFCTNLSDSMLDILFGLYQIEFEYPEMSPILLVHVTPSLQCTCRYFPSGASQMFDGYFPLMKALHVELFSRRHHFLSIPSSDFISSMVSPTRIMLALSLLHYNSLWFICDGVHLQDLLCWGLTEYEPMILEIIPFFGGDVHHETAWWILNIRQYFFLLLHQGYCSHNFLV